MAVPDMQLLIELTPYVLTSALLWAFIDAAKVGAE
jgi:hypothetical protein